MQVKIIRPKKILSLDDFHEVWRFRELMYFFTWRDFKVRYKQTFIGVLWALFQPFITMVIFSVFFGKLANMPSDGIPYPIFVYTGLVFWQFFSTALGDTSNCMITNQSIVTKVYFPRLILPLAAAAVKLVDFFIAILILFGMMFYYGYAPSVSGILIIPVLVFLTFCSSIGLGLILASLNIKYRDVRHVLPFFMQSLMFLTPVIYPASIAEKYSWILALNPMTGVIESARAGILGTAPINFDLLLSSSLISLLLVVVGVVSFKKMERYFADLI